MSSESRRHIRMWWIGLCLAALGCGGSGDGLTAVTGTVTLDGQPLADAEMTFLPEHGRPSWGKTDENGHYHLQYTADEAGAVPGPHRVTVSTLIERDRDSSNPLIQQGRPESVPPQYNKRTTLRVDVQADQRQTLDFALDSAADRSPDRRPTLGGFAVSAETHR